MQEAVLLIKLINHLIIAPSYFYVLISTIVSALKRVSEFPITARHLQNKPLRFHNKSLKTLPKEPFTVKHLQGVSVGF